MLYPYYRVSHYTIQIVSMVTEVSFSYTLYCIMWFALSAEVGFCPSLCTTNYLSVIRSERSCSLWSVTEAPHIICFSLKSPAMSTFFCWFLRLYTKRCRNAWYSVHYEVFQLYPYVFFCLFACLRSVLLYVLLESWWIHRVATRVPASLVQTNFCLVVV